MRSVLLRIAWRNVRKNWRHSLGSMLAVVVGFVAIGLFDGYLTQFTREMGGLAEERFMTGSLIVEATGASEAITTAKPDVPRLGEREQEFVEAYLRDRAEEVVVRSRVLLLFGYASAGRASTQFVGWGYDPVEGAALRRRFAWDAWNGRPLHLAGPDSVQLGRGLGALLDCVPTTDERATGDDGLVIPKERPFACKRPRVQLITTTVSGQVNAVQPTVVALGDAQRREMDVKLLYMPLALAQQLRNTRDVSLYSVLLRDPAGAGRFSGDLVAAARAKGLAIDAMPWQDHYVGEMFKQAQQVLATFRGLMAVVVVVIAGMAVFTTMVKSVSERTREIGTLRSLGFLRRHVTRLFALEAALLAGGACLVGLVLTIAMTLAVNGAKITYDAGVMTEAIPLRISMGPSVWIQAASFLVGVAVLAAVAAARRAVRQRIPDALAHA